MGSRRAGITLPRVSWSEAADRGAHAISGEPRFAQRSVVFEHHEVGARTGSQGAPLRLDPQQAGRAQRCCRDRLVQGHRTEPHGELYGAIEVERAAGERAAREAKRRTVVSHRTRPEIRRVGRGIDPVADEQQRLALGPGGQRDDRRVDVAPVADQVAGQAIVGERHTSDSALPVMQTGHRVEEMGHVAEPGADRVLHLACVGSRMAERGDDPAAAELVQQGGSASDLGRECDHQDRPLGGVEHGSALRRVVGPDCRGGLGSRSGCGDPRALEVYAERI